MAQFRCKQFTVSDDDCGMKIGTDSLLLGSYVEPGTAKTILDIGCGCGILSLMMAQKAREDAQILAVDIDGIALHRARLNAQSSPWPQKMKFVHTPIQDFPTCDKIDLVISNPPYFAPQPGALQPQHHSHMSPQRRVARHTQSLDFETLIRVTAQLLSPVGRFYCIVPHFGSFGSDETVHPLEIFAQQQGLQRIANLEIRERDTLPFSRQIFGFSAIGVKHSRQALTIRSPSGDYSAEFKALCQAFYLRF